MSAKRTSTIGYERRFNAALQIDDRQTFIELMTSAVGFTGKTLPSKPPWMRFRSTSRPMVPSVRSVRAFLVLRPSGEVGGRVPAEFASKRMQVDVQEIVGPDDVDPGRSE